MKKSVYKAGVKRKPCMELNVWVYTVYIHNILSTNKNMLTISLTLVIYLASLNTYTFTTPQI